MPLDWGWTLGGQAVAPTGANDFFAGLDPGQAGPGYQGGDSGQYNYGTPTVPNNDPNAWESGSGGNETWGGISLAGGIGSPSDPNGPGQTFTPPSSWQSMPGTQQQWGGSALQNMFGQVYNQLGGSYGGGGGGGYGGGGGGGAPPKETVHPNATYDRVSRTWSLYGLDGNPTWTSGISKADLQSRLPDELKKAHPDWWWGQEAEDTDVGWRRAKDSQAADASHFAGMGSTTYKYSPFAAWGAQGY
jgi:hypothetical protein